MLIPHAPRRPPTAMQVSLTQPAGYGYIHPTTKVTTVTVTYD